MSRGFAVVLLLAATAVFAETPKTLRPLFGRIWQVARTNPPPPGAIYIFLPNGTLLMTSCGERYRVALWSTEPKERDTIRVVEDGQPSITLALQTADTNSARLVRTLVRTGKKSTLTLTALDKEYVCPDLPK
jgi:2-polyprenyl-6-methoxyphenol hydroxylase-like FAD-dependent oxidoreductase